MKRILLTILITSVIMAAGIGTFLWKMNKISSQMSQIDEKRISQEKDIKTTGKAINSVKKSDIIPLYISGESKNVVTTEIGSTADIYNKASSEKRRAVLSNLKKKGTYTINRALWAYNPYGTNTCSMYVYFDTAQKYYCRYTVSSKDSQIPDFTRTASNGSQAATSKHHEYNITGLVPGKENYIIMKLYTEKNVCFKTVTFSVTIPESCSDAKTIATLKKGIKNISITNGLFTVFPKNKKAILLYDNSGILRSEIPLVDNSGVNVQLIYDDIGFVCAKDKFVLVNYLGQVVNAIETTGYTNLKEFDYDASGTVYVIATAIRKNATNSSKILSLGLEDESVKQALDMDSLLKKPYEKAVKTSKNKAKNWIDLDSVQVTDGVNTLIVSSKATSSIFKISNVGSVLPTIKYIISKKSIWKKYKSLSKVSLTKAQTAEQKKNSKSSVKTLLNNGKTPTEDYFTSQESQDALIFTTDLENYDAQFENKASVTQSANGSKKYYLRMLTSINGEIYYYQYYINESSKNYILGETQIMPDISESGNIQALSDKGYVYNTADGGTVIEGDYRGRPQRTFDIGTPVSRAYKYDYKGFWFV